MRRDDFLRYIKDPMLLVDLLLRLRGFTLTRFLDIRNPGFHLRSAVFRSMGNYCDSLFYSSYIQGKQQLVGDCFSGVQFKLVAVRWVVETEELEYNIRTYCAMSNHVGGLYSIAWQPSRWDV